MSAHEFTITVSDLDAGGKEFQFPVRPAWVRSALEGHEASAAQNDGSLVIRASKSGHDVVVHGTLDATLSIPCARCLERYDQPIHSDLSVLFVPGGKSGGSKGQGKNKGKGNDEEGYELSEEEADTFAFDGETIVLDDLVRDELVLEVPMVPLCSASCSGISPPPESDASASGPSREEGIDPRLLPLLRFQGKAKQ